MQDGDPGAWAKVIPVTFENNDDPDLWELPPDVPPPPPLPGAELGLANWMAWPYTQEDYEFALEQEKRGVLGWHPHRCAADHRTQRLEGREAKDRNFDCRTVIPDPRKLRYCIKHALQIKYPLTPEQVEEYSREEAKLALAGLRTVAVETLEKVMGDPDAPAGARAKAATDVLDRTGHHARAELGVAVKAEVVDMTAIIKERLEAKRQQMIAAGLIEIEPE